MSETSLATKTKPWLWPREWFRDEKFWRDVAARAASGIIVLLVGYWSAVLLGYIKQPNGLRSAFQTTVAIAVGLTIVAVVDKYSALKVSKRLSKYMNKWLARMLSTVILTAVDFFFALMIYAVLFGVFTAIKTLLGIDQPLN
ncbi:hypothetical protein B5P43_18360 [Bacillus sp. SRB_336]|nr:hypothetical protein B5P43_18360 [Bacillus sp. SRB_336]